MERKVWWIDIGFVRKQSCSDRRVICRGLSLAIAKPSEPIRYY
ncbi:hypothetical protein [Nostoc sp.]